jgi:hypothetical protein
MRKSIVSLAAATVVLLAAAPAGAAPPGAEKAPLFVPNPTLSCGLGTFLTFEGIEDSTGPGASDTATINPLDAGCAPGP